MPLLIPCLASSNRFWMPSAGASVDRVAIRPSIHGRRTAYFVVWVWMSGMPITVNEAGAGSVCHIASMAVIFIFWFSPAR
jgi:hypothetical protein